MSTLLRVLMLEDQPVDSRMVLQELRQAGYTVQADHVQTEKDFLARLEPNPDLILADHALPRFDVLRALRLLTKQGLDIPFIIVSDSISEDTAVQAMQEGAADYLVKDRLGRLGKAVAHALEKKRLRTAQRQAEHALRESEERFRNAFDYTHVAMVLTDLDHRFVRVNAAFAQLFGYSAQEILQLAMADITHPDDLAESYSRREPLLAGAVPYFQMEKRYRRKDGTILWCLTNVALIRDSNGQPQQYVGQVQDITKRKNAEEALRRSEERYRSLFENNPMPLWVYDAVTLRFLAVNEAAVRHYGYSPSEFLAMTILDVRPPEEIPALHAHLAMGAPEFGDRKIWRHRKKDGSIIEVEIASHEFTFEGRKARLVLANDVTERLRNEVLRQRLTAILEATPDLVAISPVEGPTTYINAAGRALLGLGPLDRVQLSNCQSKETRRFIQQEAIPTAIREGVWSGETVMLNRAGQEIALSQVIIAHKTASGSVEALSTIARDIREQKRLEERFRQAQKMEAIGRLAGAVAHDFNNLLTIINGYCDLVLADLHAGDPLQNYLFEIRAAGDRAAGLTRQLLTFSRRQIVAPVVLNLNIILVELEKMLGRLIGEKIDLVIRPQPGVWQIKADPGQVEQVVLNLVVNARDAMPHGGKLTIETNNVEIDQNDAPLPTDTKPGRYVRLTISDTGCGMDQTTQARIFEPFFTTKEPGKGTGLGLATVYGIVKQSAGHIAVSSEVGEGSMFNVYFPRDDETVIETPQLSIRREPIRGSETILVAEDEEGVRGLARIVLQHHGYCVLEAANGGEALLICEQHHGPIHLLITDVAMPHMNGRQLSERLTVVKPGLKVLYVSGYTDEAIMQHGALEGGTPILHKPFSPEILARKVREVIDS